MLHVEFTVEPFVEGHLGPHVTAAISAVEGLGVPVEIGPFSSGFDVPAHRVGEVVSGLLTGAYSNGATHVAVQVEAVAQ